MKMKVSPERSPVEHIPVEMYSISGFGDADIESDTISHHDDEKSIGGESSSGHTSDSEIRWDNIGDTH